MNGPLRASGSDCWPGVTTGEVARRPGTFVTRLSEVFRGRLPPHDIVRAQDLPEVSGRDDQVLLRFATDEGRVVATHDVSTMQEQIDRIAMRADSDGSGFDASRRRYR